MNEVQSSVSAKVSEIARKLNSAGAPPEFTGDQSRVLLRVWRSLASGAPLGRDAVAYIARSVGVSVDAANDFLASVSEKDGRGRIVGAVGLSQNQHPHRFTVDGVQLAAWCAWDALFIPAGLQKTATVESTSPVSGEKVRVVVSQDGVNDLSPAGAVVTISVPDAPVSSVEEACMVFCQQVLFFASREEAEGWASGRTGIEVLSVADGFDLGRAAFSSVFKHG